MAKQIVQDARVLLVDDNPADVLTIQERLSRDALVSFHLEVVERLDQGLEKLRGQRYDILLLNLRLSGSQGIETFERVRASTPDIPVIVLAASQDEADAIQAVHAGAQDYLIKSQPGLEFLPRVVRYAVERAHAITSLQASERRYQALVDASGEPEQAEAMLRFRLRLSELAFTCDTKELITIALDEAEALTGSRYGFFHMLDGDQKEITLNVWSTSVVKNMHITPDEPHGIISAGGLDECIATKAPVILNEGLRIPQAHALPENHMPISRQVIVPVLKNGMVTAVMAIGNKSVDYTKDDAAMIQELALILVNYVARKQAEESLRRNETHLRQSEERLTLALTASWMGVWEFNWETDTFFWSPECLHIFGLDAFDGTLNSFLSFVHPEDVNQLVSSFTNAIHKNQPIAVEFRIIWTTGEVRWISSYGRCMCSENGQPVYMNGTIQDITERKRTQNERLVLMEIMQGSFESEDLTAFLQLVHKAVSSVIKAENFFVILYNKHTGLFEEVYAVDEFDPPMTPDRLENSISAYVYRTGQPMLMNLSEFRRLEEDGELELVGTQTASWLGVPLKTYGETIGVFAVQDYRDPDCYTEQDRDFLFSIAGQIALAVERKRAETEIRHLNRQMELILNSAGDGVYGVDTDGLITFMNPAMAKMVGYSNHELIGRNMHDTCHYAYEGGRIYEIEDCSILLAMRKGITVHSDTEIFWRKDGSSFPVEFTSTPIHEGDQITGAVVVIKDITERKRAEEEAQQRTARTEAFDHFSQLLATQGASENNIIEMLARELVNLLGDDCIILMVSGETEQLDPPKVFFQGEVISRALEELISFAPRNIHPGLIGNVFRTGESIILSTLPIDRIRTLAVPEFIEWRENHHISDVACLPLNAQGKILGVVGVVHSSSSMVYTKEDIEFLQGLTDRAALAIVNARLLEQVRRHNMELEHRVEERTSDLSRANSELERAARAKDEFLASMSHELRTPLNAILTLTESLEEGIYGELRDAQLKPLRTVSESGHHLLNLINDILDLSKIEAGKLTLQIGNVEIEPVCHSSLRLIKQQAQKKRLHITLHLDEKAQFVQADPRCLKQMLVNLLSNAVKFTPEGGHIGLEVNGDVDQGALSFTVWDNGIGIDVKDAERLFQPFVQVDSSLSRQYGGTGLGLSLVYRMAELHRGSVSMSSAPGQGSRFTIMLPWEQGAGADGSVVSGLHKLQGRHKAIIIEESSTAADKIEQYLSEVGLKVFIQASGESALRKIVEILPDVIILSILLPDITGWEVLERIKNDPRTQNIPVIILSLLDEPERGAAMGAADYLVKPVTRARLHNALRKAIPCLNDTGDNIIAWEFSQRPVVLITEDNPANQITFSDYLTAKGCQVALAGNGIEAVERAHEVQPDLILMDIQMPGLDGLETIRRMRLDPDLQGIPIIALTALEMPGDRERCISCGADDYLIKPISLKKLVHAVSEHLSRKAT